MEGAILHSIKKQKVMPYLPTAITLLDCYSPLSGFTAYHWTDIICRFALGSNEKVELYIEEKIYHPRIIIESVIITNDLE
jgi:hypothetical protein